MTSRKKMRVFFKLVVVDSFLFYIYLSKPLQVLNLTLFSIIFIIVVVSTFHEFARRHKITCKGSSDSSRLWCLGYQAHFIRCLGHSKQTTSRRAYICSSASACFLERCIDGTVYCQHTIISNDLII